MDVRRNPWSWMAAAFCASLTLAASIVAIFGIDRGVPIALAATARLAFLMFWPAYAGRALTSLFGNIFSPVRDHAPDLGLAFAGALLAHLGLVAYLCARGHAPGIGTFVIFGGAAGFTYLPREAGAASKTLAANPVRRYELHCPCVSRRFQQITIGRLAQHRKISSLRHPRSRWSGLEARRMGAEPETYASAVVPSPRQVNDLRVRSNNRHLGFNGSWYRWQE